MRDLTVERLREVLSYDRETGVFIWKIATGPRACPGKIAGSIDKDGYRVIKIDGRLYKAHRLAWFYIHGVAPAGEIDHRNTSRDDNRVTNLRESTRLFNMQNQKTAHSNNQSGFLGVSKRPGGRWIARILVNGRKKNLGTFESPELAHAEYLSAKLAFHEGYSS